MKTISSHRARWMICIFLIAIISIAISAFVISRNQAEFDPTVDNTSVRAFSQPLETLTQEQNQSFIIGKSLFHEYSAADQNYELKGVGPVFVAFTCGECHVRDGRGNPHSTPSLLTKTYEQDDKETTSYQRIAPPIFGSGLIEAIPNSWFVETQDPRDKNKDGISGRIGWIATANGKLIGRFGWKATEVSVKDQSLRAAFEDIGLTNSHFSVCGKKVCSQKNDLSLTQEKNLIFYARSLAPPSQRELTEESRKGKALFASLGCAQCHSPSVPVEKSDVSIADGEISPYSDFLLHNMGKQLADSSAMFGRDADEFRTAPLWGLGLQKKVNGSLHLLHDGRAQTIDEAITFHGGEAKDSTNMYSRLSKSDRTAVIKYLETL